MSTCPDESQVPWVDPIVAEVRAARRRIVEAFGGDLHALCEQLRRHEQAAGRVRVNYPPRPPRPESGQAA